MANQVSALFGHGGVGLNDKLPKILREISGLTVSVLSGVAANTKMDVANIRTGNRIISALVFDNSGVSDDLSNVSIVDLRATGTITLSNAIPVEDDSVEIDGVTFVFKDGAGSETEVEIGANLTETAANLAAKVNRYGTAYSGSYNRHPTVTASASGAVVTITAVQEGSASNSITISRDFATQGNASVSGATLAGGSDTGGIKSASDNSSKTLVLTWCDVTL